MRDIFAKCREDGGYFGPFRVQDDTYFTRPILEGPLGPHMKFMGKDVVVWAINNYLGLVGNEEVRSIALDTVKTWGTYSPMGSRMVSGNTEEHNELERKLADFSQKQAAVLFNYGYLGVLGTIGSMVGPEDVIVMDGLSHASLVDGTMLASFGRRFRPYKHNDLANLEFHLKGAAKDCKGGILIVTEGVFGMRGDLGDLPGICALKEKYGARIFVDDAHGFGVMGPGGRGTAELLGVQDKIDLYFSTFAKAFAAIGGFTSGDEEPVRYVKYNARTNIFAKSLPMVYVKAVSKTLDLIMTKPDMRARMWEITKKLQAGLTGLGYDIGDTKTPITPVYVPAGSVETAMAMIKMLREDYSIFVGGVMYPVVPPGVVMFRIIPTAAHTEEDVERTLAGFKNLRDRMKLDLSQKPSLKNK